jgi:hypothetical protein
VRDDAESSAGWSVLLRAMFDELRAGAPRAESYWAQQLAFGPVFFYAVALADRHNRIAPADRQLLAGLVSVALSLLGTLPDGCAGDPTALQLLAHRQALALTSGRRRHLARLGARLGLGANDGLSGPVPRRFTRPYPLLGWVPPAALATARPR